MTQKQRIITKLRADGNVSRNSALRNYISRLSAIIQDLEKDGWVFETKQVNNDYIYLVKESPLKEVIYKISDGREIKTYA